jgi:hypothetical protein
MSRLGVLPEWRSLGLVEVSSQKPLAEFGVTHQAVMRSRRRKLIFSTED